ncbi:MAG: cation transporter [Bacteroidales bacterium]
MMKKKYAITGMTCRHCAAAVKEAFESHPDVISADVDLDNGQVQAEVNNAPKVADLNKLVQQRGAYAVTGEHE